jgi:acyl carrier protein
VSISQEIRQILEKHGHLATSVDALDDAADLYRAGLTSHASVNVMLALEARFDIEFPDRMLGRGVFRTIASIREGVEELVGDGEALAAPLAVQGGAA